MSSTKQSTHYAERLEHSVKTIQEFIDNNRSSTRDLKDIYLHEDEQGKITLITTVLSPPIRTPAIHLLFLRRTPHGTHWDHEIAEIVPRWKFQPDIPLTLTPYLHHPNVRPLRESNHLMDFSNAEFLQQYQDLLGWFQ